MKRGLLALIGFLMIIIATLVSAKQFDLTGCRGVQLCDKGFTCGLYDSLCPDDFFTDTPTCQLDPEPNGDGMMQCIDPDCSTCITGTVKMIEPPNDGISGATITYEQKVNNSITVETITRTATSDASGAYTLSDLPSGNEIFIFAEAEGYTSALEGPLFNIIPKPLSDCHTVDFLLANGTCTGNCTRTGSNFCSASCEGKGKPEDKCLFDKSETYNSYTLDSTPFEACTKFGVQAGSVIDIGSYDDNGETMCIKVRCCEGVPFEMPCPDASSIESTVSSDILENLIKVTRIAKYKGEAVKIRVYYWE